MVFTIWAKQGRRRAACVVLAACTAGGILGTTVASAETPSAEPAAFTLLKNHFGIAPGAGFFLDETRLGTRLNDLKTLGVHWIRSSINWKSFQPDDPNALPAGAPKFRWKSIDAFIAKVHEPLYAGRFNFIITVDGPPDWAKAPSRIGHIACVRQPPFDLASYAFATAALAARLKTTAHVFELQNSPNIGIRSAAHDNTVAAWPVPNPCGYTQLLKSTYAAVKGLRIGAGVLVGGIGGVQDVPDERIAADRFLGALYANGARGSFDGVSYHPYSTPDLPCAPSDSVCVFNPSTTSPYGMKNGWNRMLKARMIMVANGDGAKKIWITEFGGPTDGPLGSDMVLTESEQATLLVAGFQRASQYTWAGPFCWFTYDDDAGDPETAPNGTWMGLRYRDRTRKQSYFTYQYLHGYAQ